MKGIKFRYCNFLGSGSLCMISSGIGSLLESVSVVTTVFPSFEFKFYYSVSNKVNVFFFDEFYEP